MSYAQANNYFGLFERIGSHCSL